MTDNIKRQFGAADSVAASMPYWLFGAFEGGVTGSYFRVRQTCGQMKVPMPSFYKVVRGGGPYACAVSTFFGSSNIFNRWSKEKFGSSPFVSAIWSGVAGTVCLNPLEMRIVYKAIKKRRDFAKMVRRMGMPFVMVGGVPAAIRNVALTFGCYYMPSAASQSSPEKRLAYAALIGSVVGFVSQPMDNVSTEVKKVAVASGTFPSSSGVAVKMFRERGWRSFFQGTVLRCLFRLPICMSLMELAREVEKRT